MDEIGQAIRKGREILLTNEKTCRKVDAAEKTICRGLDLACDSVATEFFYFEEGGV